MVRGSRSGSPPSSGQNHMCRCSPSTGSSKPAIAAISFDHLPAQQTTVPHAISPFVVSTPAMRPSSTRMPVTSQPWRTSIPRAYHCTTDSGDAYPSSSQ